MILLISDFSDNSIEVIINYLIIAKSEYYLIRTQVDNVEIIEIDLKEFVLEINGQDIIESRKITWVYFRRDYLELKNNLMINDIFDANNIIKFLNTENKYCEQYINLILYKFKKIIGNPFMINVNKLEILLKAKEIGLKIPPFLITTNKTSLFEFIKVHQKIISKPINTQMFFYRDNEIGGIYTTELEEEILKDLPDIFYPSFFQKQIIKKFDIRTFIIQDKCYSMAILSQNNNKTIIDFRNYDRTRPNRRIPYKLPEIIESQLVKLHKSIKLNCSSVDVLLSTDNEYFFLEINPVGQFGMVSFPCNYYLEKIIANELSQ